MAPLSQLSGWLLKKGRRTRRWKKRFFVLTDCGLVFFKVKTKWSGKKSINIQGFYALSGAEIVGRTRETKHGQFAFQLVTHSDASESAGPASESKNCELAMSTKELAAEWRSAIVDAAASAGAVTLRGTPEEYLSLLTEEEKAEILARSGPQDEQHDCRDVVLLSDDAPSKAHPAETEATSLLPSTPDAASAVSRRRSSSLHLPASLKVLEQEAAEIAGAARSPSHSARGAPPPSWRLLRVDGGARVFSPSNARQAESVFASGSSGRSVLKVVATVAEDPRRVCAVYLDCAHRHEWDPTWAEGGVVDACGEDPMQLIRYTTRPFRAAGWPVSVAARAYTLKQHWRKDEDEETFTITGISEPPGRVFAAKRGPRRGGGGGGGGGCCGGRARASAALLDEVIRVAPSCR